MISILWDWWGGLKILDNNKNSAIYITASFPAFLTSGDIFQIFIVIAAILVLILGCSTFYKRKKLSDKTNKRISSLRREFNNVKEEGLSQNADNWIEDRLNEEDPDLEDMMPHNKR